MYVYILRSIKDPTKIYIGKTANLNKRIKQHNQGLSKYTSKFPPWKIEVAIWLQDEKTANSLECYLKTGSGRAFSKKRFNI